MLFPLEDYMLMTNRDQHKSGDHVVLRHGYKMPKIGLGTYNLPKDHIETLVKEALLMGYQHLDTAPIYLNEKAIGKAIKSSGIDRHKIFITSKIPPHIKNYESTLKFAKRSLENLGLEYLDALLINNPVPWGKEGEDYSKENLDVWKALEKLYKEERVGAIGVSNFTTKDLDQLIPYVNIKPHINQLGIFVGHTLDEIRTYCLEHKIAIQGHSPLARGRIFNIELLKSIANKHQLKPAQVAIKYVLEKNVYPIIKASSLDHMRENLALDFSLSHQDMVELDQVIRDVRDYKPPNATDIL